MSEEEEQNRFSLRKLSIGLASVLVGVSIFGTSQTVKADTVADQNTSAVTSNAQSSDTQENKNAVKSSFSNDNQANNAKSNLIQTQVEGKNEQKQVQTENGQQDSVSKTQEATDSNDLQQKDAEKGVVRTSSLQKTDNQSNDHAEDNSQTQPQNSKKLAKKVLATNLIETTSSPTTNGGFNEATWGKLDVNDWQGSVQDGLYQLTSYTGDLSHIIVPNEADFEKAGKSTNGLQVGITSDTVKSLVSDQTQTIAFSKTNDQKVKAIGTDWSHAFNSSNSRNSTLSKFDGSSLDVSNVTDMSYMFYNNKVSDLTSLANWDTSKVTDMSYMFGDNQISDLSPLTHWDTSKVTDMGGMFEINSISDLTPLKNWDTSNVTIMFFIFGQNSISDLSPLANWNTDNVTNMNGMFALNPDLIDLSPIANWNIWNISGVDNSDDYDYSFYELFAEDTKLNLTNINDTPLMKVFLKEPNANALSLATFITNNTDLVKATINKNLPDSTNTAKRTITFNFPDGTSKTIVQTINYKAITTVQVDFNPASPQIVKTYPVKASDWQLDDAYRKENDDNSITVNGQVYFKPVSIPHINGYKAEVTRIPSNSMNPGNSMKLMIRFIAVPTENKPSIPVEVAPSKPSAPSDSQFTDLDHKVVNTLNQSDSGWTMPENNSTYTVEIPADDAIIDLSDLVIAKPIHAQTRTQIRVNKHFKLSKKHVAKHLKHRKKAVRTFRKYRL